MASQTGSIDLTASNSVKLAAEAGWQSDLDGYYTKSEIDLTVEGIESTVSETYATKQEFENLEVGGRNLLRSTGDFAGWLTSGNYAGSATEGIWTFPAPSSLNWSNVGSPVPNFALSDYDGETLTLSFDYRSDDFSDTSGSHYVYVNVHGYASAYTGTRTKYRQISTPTFNGVFVPTTKWQRGSITFTMSENLLMSGSGTVTYFGITFYNYTLNSYQLRHVKLEKGNKATDWTPAPEDIETRVSSAESAITQNAQNIELKVSKDGVISSINQSSESVSINASKINLTGAVTISDLASDASGALTDAAKTATNYVTDINNNGITVHPKRSDYATNGGRAVINADGLTVYVGSDDVASYGASARIGKSNSDRVTVDSTNGITIYKSNSKRLQTTANGIDVYGSDGTTSIASFGSTVTLASDDDNHLVLDGDGLEFLDADDNRLFYIEPYDGDGIPEDSSVTLSTDSGWFVVDAGGLAYLRVGSDDIEMLVKKGSASQTALYASGSEVGVGQPLYAYSGVTSSYQVVAVDANTQNSIALRYNTAGNRGLYDIDDTEWILYRPYNTKNIVINGENFSVDTSGLVNAGRKVVAAGNKMVALAASATSGSTNRGLWDETDGAWIIYRSTDGSIVLGGSASDVLYHRTSTCTINSTNATLYNNLNNCWNNGACCTITLAVKLKAALASGNTVDIATAPENFRPPNTVSGSVYVTGQSVDLQAQAYAGGLIRLNNRSGSSASTSAQIYISFTFAL